MLRCALCGVEFEKTGRRGPAPKHCSERCRSRARWEAQKQQHHCPQCGGPMARPSSSSAKEPKCRTCWQRHGGAGRYRKGCRCEVCKAGNAERMREYVAARKRAGNPVTYARKTESAICAYCGREHQAVVGRDAVRRFCSDLCSRRFKGWDGAPRDRWRPSQATRRRILERDGMTCQLCQSPVRTDVEPTHPRYPNLDHIVPRSLGGSDEESNLRCACRQCNVLRGADVDWTPVEVAS